MLDRHDAQARHPRSASPRGPRRSANAGAFTAGNAGPRRRRVSAIGVSRQGRPSGRPLLFSGLHGHGGTSTNRRTACASRVSSSGKNTNGRPAQRSMMRPVWSTRSVPDSGRLQSRCVHVKHHIPGAGGRHGFIAATSGAVATSERKARRFIRVLLRCRAGRREPLPQP